MKIANDRRWIAICLATLALAGLSTTASAQALAGDDKPAPAAGVDASSTTDELHDALKFEPTGLSLLRPYEKGKIPVVFVHGLWGSPLLWARMIEVLEADPALKAKYQFWTFGYSTGDPIPYSAFLLRQALLESRRQLDPDRADPAFDRMVLVGHSMGGLLSKLMVLASEDRFWGRISDRPFAEMKAKDEDRALLRDTMFFQPVPEVRRLVFIATPHRGSVINNGAINGIGRRLIRLPDPLQEIHGDLIAKNGRDFFKPPFRDGLPTSVDQLAWQHPLLMKINDVPTPTKVARHSIIANRLAAEPGGTDGAVTYESSHLDDVASETVIKAGHLCLSHPAVIAETRRILREHIK